MTRSLFPWTLGELAKCIDGVLLSGSPGKAVRGVSTDTRTIRAGEAFLALVGERFDGHDFLDEAVSRGAVALIVSREGKVSPGFDETAVIRVDDTLMALGKVAGTLRDSVSIPVVGITGSNGKTTTKEMLSAILAKKGPVLRNPGNFNNLVGVPLTWFRLDSRHAFAVIEMGINLPGEMERLIGISKPTIGVITNVQPAHLEGLKSVEQVLVEKGRLWESLPHHGWAVVNGDDAFLTAHARRLGCRRLIWSLQDRNHRVTVSSAPRVTPQGTEFTLVVDGEKERMRLPVLGRHHVANALAATAAARCLGLSLEEIVVGLTTWRPLSQRMEKLDLPDGRIVINDTYNANPRSMVAAFEAVREAARADPVAVVLGDMRELGPESEDYHRMVGEKLAQEGVAFLVTLGTMGREIGVGARRAGLETSKYFHASDHKEAARWILEVLPSPGWILVKGSRGMTMEMVVEAIGDRFLSAKGEED